jgi:hypothetical protein
MFSGYKFKLDNGIIGTYLKIPIHYIVFVKFLNTQKYLTKVEFCNRFTELPMLCYKEKELSTGTKFQNKV